MSRRQPSRFGPVARRRGVVLFMVAMVPALARAAVEWHPNLDTAHAAARISHRPVLAVFVANWEADTAAFEAACLGSAEAEAVLVTCFEPVRIDVDDHPELARSVGVTYVPTACVLSADDVPLVRMGRPESPAAFVSTAILAAQRIAAEREAGPTADAAASGGAVESSPADNRSPRGSLARVTAKVRDLSAFAMHHARPKPDDEPIATTPTTPPAIDPPQAGPNPPWPADTSASSPTAGVARSSIEPAATPAAPAPRAPWLDGAGQQPAVAAAPAAPPSAAPPASAPAAPEAPTPSWQSRFIAALQKPFGWGAKDSDPPTMPPAKPQGLFAAATAPDRAAPESTPAPDPYGSMPLGLEGYCPVTLVDRGTWAEGRAQWGARHRGRTYLFAGAAEQETFLADPDRYAPACSGDDPVLALDHNSSTPGQRRYGVTYRSRMYLFASPETRQAFSADPDRYAARIALAERVPPPAEGSRRY